MGLYTVPEAAEELQVPERRIREMCKSGRLDAVKNGKSWLIQLGRPQKDTRSTSGRDVMRGKGRNA
jgi:excisionase family DNA binding protein